MPMSPISIIHISKVGNCGYWVPYSYIHITYKVNGIAGEFTEHQNYRMGTTDGLWTLQTEYK